MVRYIVPQFLYRRVLPVTESAAGNRKTICHESSSVREHMFLAVCLWSKIGRAYGRNTFRNGYRNIILYCARVAERDSSIILYNIMHIVRRRAVILCIVACGVKFFLAYFPKPGLSDQQILHSAELLMRILCLNVNII